MPKQQLTDLGDPDYISDLDQLPIRAVVEARPKDGLPELNVLGSVNDSDEVIWRSPVWGIDGTMPPDPWDRDKLSLRVALLVARFTHALHAQLMEHLEVDH